MTSHQGPKDDHDIIAQFQKDWSDARAANDPNAPFCTLATVDHETGFPKMRTVGLREIDAEKGTFLLLVNQKSPKLHELKTSGGKFELMTFWQQPNMLQYRIAGDKWSLLEEDDVRERWKGKPKMAQLLDHYYEHYQGQSTVLDGRESFLDTMKALAQEYADKEVPFPSSIPTGLVLSPTVIEEWRGSPTDRLHERYLYTRPASGMQWNKQALVP